MIAIDSDHRMVIGHFELKLANLKKKKNNSVKRKKYHKPNEEQLIEYNNNIMAQQGNIDWDNVDNPAEIFTKILQESAEKTLTEVSAKQNKDYITEKTWELMEQREKAIAQGDKFEADHLNKQIKYAVKEDKRAAKLEQLKEIDERGYKWEGIKRLKSTFTPKFCKFKDKNGKRIPEKEYAQKAAEYLAGVQWKLNEELPERIFRPRIEMPGLQF